MLCVCLRQRQKGAQDPGEHVFLKGRLPGAQGTWVSGGQKWLEVSETPVCRWDAGGITTLTSWVGKWRD